MSSPEVAPPIPSLLIGDSDGVGDLIGDCTFSELLFLLAGKRRPNSDELIVFDTVLSVLCAHGQLGSHEMAVRMVSSPINEAIQVEIAAGLLGISKKILGAMQEAGELLTEFDVMTSEGEDPAAVADRLVQRARRSRTRLPGFGHTTFVGGDPRVPRLLQIVEDHGVAGRHIEHVLEMERAIERELGRHLPLNVTGAVAASCLELDLPWQLFRGFALLSRTAALVAHAAEERLNPMIPASLERELRGLKTGEPKRA